MTPSCSAASGRPRTLVACRSGGRTLESAGADAVPRLSSCQERSWLVVRFSLPASFSIAIALSGAAVAVASPPGDRVVTVGSPSTPFSQNKQNEPAVAIDAHNPVVVAGANEEIDMESCAAGDPSTCPFTNGVGVSGAYFSFDSGASWTSRRTAAGPLVAASAPRPALRRWVRSAPCPTTSRAGSSPTETRRWPSDRGPAPAGRFSWANGSRLYYANLTSNSGATRLATFRGFEAIAVSSTDNVRGAAADNASAWRAPVSSPSSRRRRSPTRSRSGPTTRSQPVLRQRLRVLGVVPQQEKGNALPDRSSSRDPLTAGPVGPLVRSARRRQRHQQQPDGCTVRTDSTARSTSSASAPDRAPTSR